MLTFKRLACVFLAVCTAVLLSACHPKVEPASDMDKELSCSQLKEEIQRVKDVRAKIEKKRGFSPRNVGLGLIFWPGIVINEVTGDTAETEAKEKLVALQNIYAKKSCSKHELAAAEKKTEVKEDQDKLAKAKENKNKRKG